jgi:hypothetical protein
MRPPLPRKTAETACLGGVGQATPGHVVLVRRATRGPLECGGGNHTPNAATSPCGAGSGFTAGTPIHRVPPLGQYGISTRSRLSPAFPSLSPRGRRRDPAPAAAAEVPSLGCRCWPRVACIASSRSLQITYARIACSTLGTNWSMSGSSCRASFGCRLYRVIDSEHVAGQGGRRWASPARADDFTGKDRRFQRRRHHHRAAGAHPSQDPLARHRRPSGGLVLGVARRPVEGDARAYHVFQLVGVRPYRRAIAVAWGSTLCRSRDDDGVGPIRAVRGDGPHALPPVRREQPSGHGRGAG